MVEAIIARLSLETGPHFGNRGTDSSNDDHSDGHGHGAWTDSGEEEDGLLKPEHFDDDEDES